MKAEINENGMLTIKTETPLESYALKKWLDENKEIGGEKLMFILNTKLEENENRK